LAGLQADFVKTEKSFKKKEKFSQKILTFL